MKHPLLKVGSLIIAALIPLSGFSADTYKPANFNFQGADLATLVAKPYIFTSTTPLPVMYCQSDISAQGDAKNTQCHDASGNYHVEILTEGAIDQLNFSPAEVSGSTVPVRMSYRVVFSGESDNVAVSLIPNLGSMQDKFGVGYFAPQERLDVANWQESFKNKTKTHGAPFLADAALSRITATVDESGKAVSVRTLSVERGKKKDARLVKKALTQSRFIPGFVDGKPQMVGYLAVINYDTRSDTVASE